MRPNDLRIRFLPVKDCAIYVSQAARGEPRAKLIHASTLEPLLDGSAGRRKPPLEGALLRRTGGRMPCLGAVARDEIAFGANQFLRENSGDSRFDSAWKEGR